MNIAMANDDTDFGAQAGGAAQSIYRGIMQDLECHRMVPGQRLIETELAIRFGVGRNAVREAIQRLAARGVVDISRNRSPAIRQLDMAETMEVLDVAAVMTGLATGSAARRFEPALHQAAFAQAMQQLIDAGALSEPGVFSQARRGFYRMILSIGGNRELQRLFPAIGMHIIYSQFQSPQLQHVRLADYQAIYDAISRNDVNAAEQAGQNHVETVRRILKEIML
jgi:DNA-binding GntR family transcriptional regulator